MLLFWCWSTGLYCFDVGCICWGYCFDVDDWSTGLLHCCWCCAGSNRRRMLETTLAACALLLWNSRHLPSATEPPCVFVQILRNICTNCKTYLSKLRYICQNSLHLASLGEGATSSEFAQVAKRPKGPQKTKIGQSEVAPQNCLCLWDSWLKSNVMLASIILKPWNKN